MNLLINNVYLKLFISNLPPDRIFSFINFSFFFPDPCQEEGRHHRPHLRVGVRRVLSPFAHVHALLLLPPQRRGPIQRLLALPTHHRLLLVLSELVRQPRRPLLG